MKKKKIALPMAKCSQCGEIWQLRVKNPKKCPNCQSRQWDKPNVLRKTARGVR